ncbi:MAG: hypothetical protein P8P40_14500, partial [Sulfitobacter sp.]|nr:hypothetical protein [Sulfitobacter sp.]
AVTSIGTIVGNAIDFPYSPVRMIVLMLPPDASAETVSFVLCGWLPFCKSFFVHGISSEAVLCSAC